MIADVSCYVKSNNDAAMSTNRPGLDRWHMLEKKGHTYNTTLD
jgi:hypothetical protein